MIILMTAILGFSWLLWGTITLLSTAHLVVSESDSRNNKSLFQDSRQDKFRCLPNVLSFLYAFLGYYELNSGYINFKEKLFTQL